ncbi:MAG TPA: glycosyl hydrolase family 18 protein [Candidatus Dormibacteraeota bacterium]
MAVAIVLVVAAPGTAPASAPTRTQVANPHVAATTAHTQREVFGFALASSLADPTVGYPTWNFDLLSTVAFFGLHVGSAGQIAGDAGWTTWNSSALTNLVSIAHQHGTKVVLTVILQDFSPNTPNMCDGLMHADATVAQTVNEVRAKGVDGVNLDYEGLDGSCGTNDPYWAQHSFTVLAQKMRAGLGSSYYLSVDTYASSAADGYGFFDVPNLATYVDSFFVMAYDLEYSNYSRPPSSCSRFCLGPTGPLGAYYYNDSTVASQYVAAVGAGKVILGVPYYGRKACVGAAVPNGFPTSSVIADSYLDASTEASDPAVATGSYASHRDAYSSGAERWDTWYNTSLGCTRELYWDDATSLGKKYDLVNAAKLRGAGIWNLNYGGGAPELWAALASHFSACTSISLTAAPPSPVAIGTAVTATAKAAGCANPLYEFWMRPASSTTWELIQAYSSTPTLQWSTARRAPGGYYLGVWARDAGSSGAVSTPSGGVDVYMSILTTLVSPCTSVTLAAVPASAVEIGTGVTVTANAAGCPTPVYEFWMRPASSSTWQMIQAYSSNPTLHWSTTGKSAGGYYIGVWARDASGNGIISTPTGGVDVYISIPMTLASPCSGVSLTASPTSPVAVGKVVTLTAGTAGCANPLYEFWMRSAASSTWQMIQAYSTNPTLQWSSAGKPDGIYYLGVWARDASGSGIVTTSSGGVDVYMSIPITIFSPCTAVSLSASPPSPVKVGTAVAATATAAGCPNPVYEFWMRPVTSSTWQMIQAYSNNPTLHWSTTGKPAGGYYIGVWARDASSSGVVSTGSGGVDVFISIPMSLAP